MKKNKCGIYCFTYRKTKKFEDVLNYMVAELPTSHLFCTNYENKNYTHIVIAVTKNKESTHDVIITISSDVHGGVYRHQQGKQRDK